MEFPGGEGDKEILMQFYLETVLNIVGQHNPVYSRSMGMGLGRLDGGRYLQRQTNRRLDEFEKNDESIFSEVLILNTKLLLKCLYFWNNLIGTLMCHQQKSCFLATEYTRKVVIVLKVYTLLLLTAQLFLRFSTKHV